ncbi:tRNA pseudouridine(55) synthase TruB [Enterococcus cecorum]
MEGILPLWKERGLTSHDCVFKLRKILHMKKIGHSGTLDPDVDGILPICIGRATKVVEFLTDSGKVYEGEITLGYSTTTEDASGEIVDLTPVEKVLSNELIDSTMQTFIGEITQIPPMYSAVRVNGKRLYEYARNGETVERPVRKAQIYRFQRITEPVFDAQKHTLSWRFQVACSKGTYVRTLAVDLGKKLGFVAHMSDLTRIKSGGFTKEQAVTLDQVAQAMANNEVEKSLLPIEYGVRDFPRIDISEELTKKVMNGMRIPYWQFGFNTCPDRPIALYYNNQVLSIYEVSPSDKNKLKPQKMLRTQLEMKE